MIKKNIFNDLPAKNLPDEVFELLAAGKKFKLEKIISTGQCSPEDHWYDQECSELVILLKGSAKILLKTTEDEKEVLLNSGDYLLISPHQKHRIICTDLKEPTVWLALYFEND